ncbi:MAG TPA: bifunctional (p)ppGpp synthetase/guanosine-3',5'-bis(diphosphate) 3'-pyrophosphohydrolase [Burkholderiaceae bacterium]|nr:bifunctional (p)ppGpp synthetase/guanosine-3',5'-bis(diphosphate) 3'-pyrophosphohydrolase [Burkholderiaceae bacterium]HPE00497.1 bifunctional (p)ppGpp synthetase/guanosine-3',5'-bis(diphosphate) 3'-pyrophosphohydrolase [Burkholderiaceae bacterium]HRZ00371.1 bifunctional (p)ppGpp synthetase/guanosine-3',5'-bis(diphosphate) 3'-pyrophosphohydrolase [Burkholderiaceae bacterium]
MSRSAAASDEDVAPVDVAAARALVEPLYLGRSLRTGESFLDHAEGMAAIVAPLRADLDLQAAAWLFGVHDVLREPEEWLRARFGETVAQLVGDLRQLMRLSERTRGQSAQAATEAQPEALRRMLLAMCNDLRVVLLRLASRLQTLRYLAASRHPEAAPFARETLALYAPLANRLGIWQIKWELEDLSLRFIEPETYKRVARLLEERRVERESFIEESIAQVRARLAAAGIAAEVSGRPKHIYSIWNKMRTKGLAYEQLYDVRALRVIVEDVAQCYQVLALVHADYTPIAAEFDDYIARPKANGYQSLHTVVRDAQDRPLEIQIRTRRMHEFAELGVAAHWRYKEGGRGRTGDEERVAWLRQLLAWREEIEPPARPGAEERVYVLTPQGRVVELPAGSTPVDFAYHVHTELGHRCRGARVDGAMVPLNARLHSGQTVEIVAAKTGGPSRDWLNAELGYLASARSRTKVRQWFNAQELEASIAVGRERIDKELARLGKTAVKLDDLARRLGFAGVDELCVAATKEEFSFRAIEHALAPPAAPAELPPLVRAANLRAPKGKVLVVGVDSLLTQLARCCRPAPPDEIVGFVTRGRGVSIHRADCSNAQALGEREHERLIEVTWGAQPDAVYPVEIFVVAQDRSGLLRDISEVFAREKQNVIGVNTMSSKGDARMNFTVEVSDAAELARTIALVREVKGVMSARRR